MNNTIITTFHNEFKIEITTDKVHEKKIYQAINDCIEAIEEDYYQPSHCSIEEYIEGLKYKIEEYQLDAEVKYIDMEENF